MHNSKLHALLILLRNNYCNRQFIHLNLIISLYVVLSNVFFFKYFSINDFLNFTYKIKVGKKGKKQKYLVIKGCDQVKPTQSRSHCNLR